LDSRGESSEKIKPTVLAAGRIEATHAPARNYYNNKAWSKLAWIQEYAWQKTASIAPGQELKDVAAKCCAFEFAC
jgi:hypothetical protein